MSWIKLLIGLGFLFFQIVFLSTMPEDEVGSSAMVFVFLYQIVFVFCLFLIWKGKYLSVAITLLLLLFLNLFTAQEFLQSDYKTLPPNMYERVRIVGDVMPGFDGVNTISTDSRGFRVTKEVNYDVDAPIRVYAIGGSTTEEINSDDGETWPALLEDKLTQEFGQDVEVINTGLSGLRAKNHLATLLRTENLYPDYYVFLVGVNDWNKQIREITQAIQPKKYDLRDTVLYRAAQILQAIILQSSHVSTSEDIVSVVELHGEYFSKQNDSLSRADVRSVTVDEVDDDYFNAMKKIAARCNSGAYKCMFISQPSAYSHKITDNLKARLWMTPTNVGSFTLDLESMIQISSFYNEWLHTFSHENGISFCDLAATQIEPSEKFFYDDVHFNESGSAFVAEEVFKCFKTQFETKDTAKK